MYMPEVGRLRLHADADWLSTFVVGDFASDEEGVKAVVSYESTNYRDVDSKEKSGGGGSLSFVLVLAAAMVVGVYYSRATR